MHRFLTARTVFSGILVAMLLAPQSGVFGQFDVGQIEIPSGIMQVNSAPSPGLKVESRISMSSGSNFGLLTIDVSMNKSWKIYSLTQPSGGPVPTKIYLKPSNDYRLLGSFAPDHPAKSEHSDVFEMNVESFEKHASWSVPIEVLGPSGNLVVRGYVEGLACAGQCVPFGEDELSFEATVTSSTASLLNATRIDGTHAEVRTWLSSAQAAPGDTVQMFVAFHADPNWHVYAYDKLPPSMFQKPTLVHAAVPVGWKQGIVKSAAPVLSKKGPIDGEPPVREYAGPATLAIPFTIPSDAKPGRYPLSGNVAFQTCATQCDRPTAFAWNGVLDVMNTPIDPQIPVAVKVAETVRYDDVVALLQGQSSSGDQTGASVAGTSDSSDTAGNATAGSPSAGSSFDLSNAEFAADTAAPTSLAKALVAAFIGGFILNFMPCVLPVIGLKIMSFVEQAGSDRGKIFKLNLWYVLGMLAIFWILAVLAAAPALGLSKTGLGWGEQFNYQGFAISLVCIVFVMALSFLGIWEIPIPGFATGNKATELSTQEGLSGAFFKGAITTLLATPCSAPGLITAYAFAVNSGSRTLPFLIFSVMGLGMGLPYLLIGAFPSLIRLLPKPGAWMDTFKQLMGFVLLATVVFLMQNVTFTNLLPTIGLLFGLWLACWWIGRVPMTAGKDKRTRAWAVSVVLGMLTYVVCFSQFGLVGHSEHKLALAMDREVSQRIENVDSAVNLASHSDDRLPWEPFNEAALNSMLQSGETVMVDFTADWCYTCRTLEATVLNTEPIREVVKANKIRTIVADWGTKDPAIGNLLDKLQGSRQIPFLAIFPAGRPEQVIRVSGVYTTGRLIELLENAGASQGPAGSATVAHDDVNKQPSATLVTSKRLP